MSLVSHSDVSLWQVKNAAALKGAVDTAQDLKSKVDGFGGIVEGLKDKINGAAITDDSPAKSVENVRFPSSRLHFGFESQVQEGRSLL